MTPEKAAHIDISRMELPADLAAKVLAVELEAPPPAAGAASYRCGREHYAALYKQTPRTINRWIAHGRTRGELPPLDEPAAMAAWWTKHMKHRVPSELLAFKPTAPAPTGSPSESVAGDTPAGEPARGSVGMGGMLERIRDAERDACEKYLLAQSADPPDQSLIEMRRRAWERMAETLRKIEKDSPGIMAASGDVLPRTETLEQLAQMLGILALTWRGFARRMLPVLRGLSIEEADKRWALEADRVFAAIQENQLTAPLSAAA